MSRFLSCQFTSQPGACSAESCLCVNCERDSKICGCGHAAFMHYSQPTSCECQSFLTGIGNRCECGHLRVHHLSETVSPASTPMLTSQHVLQTPNINTKSRSSHSSSSMKPLSVKFALRKERPTISPRHKRVPELDVSSVLTTKRRSSTSISSGSRLSYKLASTSESDNTKHAQLRKRSKALCIMSDSSSDSPKRKARVQFKDSLSWKNSSSDEEQPVKHECPLEIAVGRNIFNIFFPYFKLIGIPENCKSVDNFRDYSGAIRCSANLIRWFDTKPIIIHKYFIRILSMLGSILQVLGCEKLAQSDIDSVWELSIERKITERKRAEGKPDEVSSDMESASSVYEEGESAVKREAECATKYEEKLLPMLCEDGNAVNLPDANMQLRY